jgi:hypothetical protein
MIDIENWIASLLAIESRVTSLLASTTSLLASTTSLLASESLAPACMLAGGAIVVILLLAEALKVFPAGRLRTSVRSVALLGVAVAGGLAAFAAGRTTTTTDTTLAWIEDLTAQANARAAEAEKRAVEASERARAATQQAGLAVERAGGAYERALELERQVEALKAANLELSDRNLVTGSIIGVGDSQLTKSDSRLPAAAISIKPRTLSAEQDKLLRYGINGRGRPITVVRIPDGEPGAYSHSVAGALERSRFKVHTELLLDKPADTGVVVCEMTKMDIYVFKVLQQAGIATRYAEIGAKDRPAFCGPAARTGIVQSALTAVSPPALRPRLRIYVGEQPAKP